MTLFEVLSLVAGLASGGGLFGVLFFGGRFVGRIETSMMLATTATVGMQAEVKEQGQRLTKVEADLALLHDANRHHMNSFHAELGRKIDEIGATATEARVQSSHNWTEPKR